MPVLVPPHLPAGSLSSRAQPTITGDDLVLRPFEPSDAPWLVSVYEDPEIQRWHLRRFDSTDEAEQWIDETHTEWAAETDGQWLVADATDGTPLGRMGLRDISLTGGTAEIGYWVAREARGRGVARRALIALTRWAAGELGLHRLIVTHSTENPASCRVAAAAGYTVEGTQIRQQRHLDGWHDKHLHSFIAGDPLP